MVKLKMLDKWLNRLLTEENKNENNCKQYIASYFIFIHLFKYN